MSTKEFIEQLILYIITSTEIEGKILMNDMEKKENTLRDFIKNYENKLNKWFTKEDNILLLDEFNDCKDDENRDALQEEILDIIYDMFPLLQCIEGETKDKIIKKSINFFVKKYEIDKKYEGITKIVKIC
jgi:hypothetical protein